MDITKIKTLGDLKRSDYVSKSIKMEMRDNLIKQLYHDSDIFDGIHGYEDTVLPDVERAILSRHNILLLGLRGQAKTRIARLMTELLDEYIPIVGGSEINDDPLRPISRYAVDLIKEKGDDTPIDWLHRSARYVEKLATPDVSVADLIGDVDPIKAAALKLPYSDERVIHFGLVPRAHRCIFVLNELPDLQARIQVSLFNILQEGDLQIRGFKLRFPIDSTFVFTANPEDYTNRGSIVTPLKDRIESQILTHYPKSVEVAKVITIQEANITDEQEKTVHIEDGITTILELISFQARENEYIDEKSGVSARLSISAYENLVSTAERRAILNGEDHTAARLVDFWGVIPSITGKMELVYEGEQEGAFNVALHLINAAITEYFLARFPDPDKIEEKEPDPYEDIKSYFARGNVLDLFNDDTNTEFKEKLEAVDGLKGLANTITKDENEQYFVMELILFGLANCEVINSEIVETQVRFNDPLAGMFDLN